MEYLVVQMGFDIVELIVVLGAKSESRFFIFVYEMGDSFFWCRISRLNLFISCLLSFFSLPCLSRVKFGAIVFDLCLKF